MEILVLALLLTVVTTAATTAVAGATGQSGDASGDVVELDSQGLDDIGTTQPADVGLIYYRCNADQPTGVCRVVGVTVSTDQVGPVSEQRYLTYVHVRSGGDEFGPAAETEVGIDVWCQGDGSSVGTGARTAVSDEQIVVEPYSGNLQPENCQPEG